MDTSTGLIYMITIDTDEINKIYIGQTTRSFEKRINEHKKNICDMTRNTPLYDTMRHYGLDACTFSILEEKVCLEELNERECYWIKEKNSLFSKDNNIGLNYKDGGNSSGKWTPELREKHSTILSKYYESEEAKEANRMRQKEVYADPILHEKHSTIRSEFLDSDAGQKWKDNHSEFMQNLAHTDEGKERTREHSQFMKDYYESSEGLNRRQVHSQQHKEYYLTSAGIEERKRSSERMKIRAAKQRELIPERKCDICNYIPPNNSNPKLTRHFKTKKHINNIANLEQQK